MDKIDLVVQIDRALVDFGMKKAREKEISLSDYINLLLERERIKASKVNDLEIEL